MNSTLFFDFIQPLEVVRQQADASCQFTARGCTLLYVLSGTGRVRVDERRLSLSEGELILLPPGRCRVEGGMQFVRMAFSTSCMSFQQISPRLLCLPVPLDAEAREHVHSILSNTEEPGPFAADQIALETHYLLLTLAQTLLSAPPHASSAGTAEAEALERITAYIQEHLSEEISSQDLVACSACSSKQVYALFKKRFQTTPMKYLSGYRIETAKHLLLTSPMTITEIATACGFQTIHYFSHVFKTFTGLSPNTFRRQPDSPEASPAARRKSSEGQALS